MIVDFNNYFKMWLNNDNVVIVTDQVAAPTNKITRKIF